MDQLLTHHTLLFHDFLHDFRRILSRKDSGLVSDWRANLTSARSKSRTAREEETPVDAESDRPNSKKRPSSALNAEVGISSVSNALTARKEGRPKKSLPQRNASPLATDSQDESKQLVPVETTADYGGLQDEDPSLERAGVAESPAKGKARVSNAVSIRTLNRTFLTVNPGHCRYQDPHETTTKSF
jgi:hypothetical protein